MFTIESATEALGVRRHTLAREIRLRRLRASKRAGRHFLLGEWVLQWLKEGEVRRRHAEQQATAEVAP